MLICHLFWFYEDNILLTHKCASLAWGPILKLALAAVCAIRVSSRRLLEITEYWTNVMPHSILQHA